MVRVCACVCVSCTIACDRMQGRVVGAWHMPNVCVPPTYAERETEQAEGAMWRASVWWRGGAVRARRACVALPVPSCHPMCGAGMRAGPSRLDSIGRPGALCVVIFVCGGEW